MNIEELPDDHINLESVLVGGLDNYIRDPARPSELMSRKVCVEALSMGRHEIEAQMVVIRGFRGEKQCGRG